MGADANSHPPTSVGVSPPRSLGRQSEHLEELDGSVLSDLTGTGERIDIVGRPRTHTDLDHRGLYLWASERVSGRILDVACGTGHGSELLGGRAQIEIAGLDNNSQAVARAAARVPDGDFRVAVVPPIPFPDASFDVVVTFETVEHLKDDAQFMKEIRRVLRPGGRMLLSTPNKEITSPTGPPTNPWHIREYRLADLLTIVEGAGFQDVEVFCQSGQLDGVVHRIALKLVARFPILCRPGRWWDRLAHGAGEVERWDGRSRPTIWVLACR